MKYHSAIYTKDGIVFDENASDIVTLASISKWFYLAYFLEKQNDSKFQEDIDQMMIHSSNDATLKLAKIFGPDNVQKYVDSYVQDIFIRNSEKSINSKRSNEGSVKSIAEFLYKFSEKFHELQNYRSDIHQILSESLSIKDRFGNKPGSSPAGNGYFLGDSIIVFNDSDRIAIVSMIEVFNPHLVSLPLKVFKRILVKRLQRHIRQTMKETMAQLQ